MQTSGSNMGVKGYTLAEMMIVVLILGIIVTMARPSFRRMINSMQVERFVQQLQMEEQALRQYAIFNRGYPASASPGVFPTVPVSMQEYLPSGFDWAAPTPLGGNWKWESTSAIPNDGTQGGRARGFFFEYGITISSASAQNPLWSTNLFLEVDKRIDDGNLSTGAFRKNNNLSAYSYALQYDTKKPWGTSR
jgi:prepilin-type N-terminal cleavage/methylation domain-containing protein